jgi:hypothetical protein
MAKLGLKQRTRYAPQTPPRRAIWGRRAGLSHALANVELNRRVGLRRIAKATVSQLQKRLEQAERWPARTYRDQAPEARTSHLRAKIPDMRVVYY